VQGNGEQREEEGEKEPVKECRCTLAPGRDRSESNLKGSLFSTVLHGSLDCEEGTLSRAEPLSADEHGLGLLSLARF